MNEDEIRYVDDPELNDLIIQAVKTYGYISTMIVEVRFKYDFEDEWTIRNEVLELNGDTFEWLNDWYAGQQNIAYTGIIPLGKVKMDITQKIPCDGEGDSIMKDLRELIRFNELRFNECKGDLKAVGELTNKLFDRYKEVKSDEKKRDWLNKESCILNHYTYTDDDYSCPIIEKGNVENEYIFNVNNMSGLRVGEYKIIFTDHLNRQHIYYNCTFDEISEGSVKVSYNGSSYEGDDPTGEFNIDIDVLIDNYKSMEILGGKYSDEQKTDKEVL